MDPNAPAAEVKLGNTKPLNCQIFRPSISRTHWAAQRDVACSHVSLAEAIVAAAPWLNFRERQAARLTWFPHADSP